MASIPFLTAVANRRSMYALTKESTISQDRIFEIITHAVKYAPSPFNVRSTRIIVLFSDDHDNLWKHAYTFTAENTPDAIRILGPKIEGYQKASGTVLFFDDAAAYSSLPPRFLALSKQSTEWEEHSSGMHQFIVWTALEAEGLGANLQHYTESLTPFVREKYGVPKEWKLKCQLVFGKPSQGPGEEKPKTGLETAIKVFGRL